MKAILACDTHGGIGYKNKLPWKNLQGDLPRFKALTTGQPIVMGKNTWDSLPFKPLPNRLNIVVSSTMQPTEGVLILRDTSSLILYDDAWMIGGGKLINSCWELIDELHLSETLKQYTCDTYIDLSYLGQHFNCVRTESNADHLYQVWKRK
jgi:dihydrofolate reductase